MDKKIFFLLLITPVFCVAQPGKTKFQKMLDFYYEDILKLNPTAATFKGDNRYNDQIENPISANYRKQSISLISHYLDSLQRYDVKKLSPQDQLSYEIFQYELQNRLDGIKFDTYLTPVSQ